MTDVPPGRRRSFGVGLYTGQRDAGAHYRDAVPLAVAAEEAGFDAFWVSEHHGLPDGYLPSPLTLLAALAPATSRLTLGTGVLLAPLHHPLRIAEDAAVVDQLSGGRLVLGLGIGYAAHEYAAFGVDPATRGSRLEALVTALRSAWAGEPVHSPELGLHGARVTPPPARPVPIWLGGYAPRAVRRAGLLADGHLTGRGEPHIVGDASGHLAAVRDPADPSFTRAVNVTCVLDEPGAGTSSALRAFAAQQRTYESIQAGRDVYAGLVDGPVTGLVTGLVTGSLNGPAAPAGAGVQAYGDADAVVRTLTGVLDSLRAWANVQLVIRLLFPEPDPDVQRCRLRLFGEEILPRLRAHGEDAG
ncbi:LLM class flavin-dependent oxidoreductase [Nonomuraea sp. CA-218870]|uniref:LLM class flavin-dependent oxidoreductase n=1 Tax=Nonomuraea sp. CA-218870 TaxID=3239998 RepID=UPI003D94C75A